MHAPLDPFDPNTWTLRPAHEHRIYLDARAQAYAIVDEQDYQWAVQWRWCGKTCKRGKTYARRAVGFNQDGARLRTDSLYLHIEIMKRVGAVPLTVNHKLVDHRNGNELDCRRANLRWATHVMNARNRFGSMSHDLEDLMYAQA